MLCISDRKNKDHSKHFPCSWLQRLVKIAHTLYNVNNLPLARVTFQNDLNIFANGHNLTMYADDHQLYSAGQTVKEVQDTLSKEGEIISKWYESNLLKGNYEKYQIMSMGLKGKTKDSEITIQM